MSFNSECKVCEHGESVMNYLDDIEYVESETNKEVSLYYTCSQCGGKFTKWLNVRKT